LVKIQNGDASAWDTLIQKLEIEIALSDLA
jgi:hypothetical protein